MKKVTLFFFLYFFATSTFAESAREYFKFAKFSYESEEYLKALEFINKAIDVDPKYTNGFLLRAEINYRLQEFNEVIDDITVAFNLDENASNTMPEFHLLRADAYVNINNFNKALTDINYSISLNPNNAKAFFLKGIINTEKTIYFEAVENFDSAIKLDTDNSEYYYKRAELKKLYYKPLAGTKTYESIMADLNTSISLDPDNYRPYKLKCDMFKLDTQKGKEELIQMLDGVIARFPENEIFYSERGMANVLNYNYGTALGDFTKAIHLNESNEANYRNRGLCFHNMMKYQLALNDYSKSIKVLIKKYQASNNDVSLKRLLAQTFNLRGMTNQLNGNTDLACDDYYNAAKLGSKVGMNNYRRNCNVYN